MGNTEFEGKAKVLVMDWYADHNHPVLKTEVYTVWICKILNNNKALISTTYEDGMYFEVTYNGAADEFYLDAYEKLENMVVKC